MSTLPNTWSASQLEEWLAFQLAPDGDVEDGCHPDEAQALKDYLRNKTTASEAAEAITHPVRTADYSEDDLSRLWGFLDIALVELPKDHLSKMIELLQAIEKLPEPDSTAVGDDSKPPREKIWKGLTGFGHMWFDAYQNGCWIENAIKTEGSERDTLRNEYERRALVEATLVKKGIGNFNLDEGYERIADALESSNATLDFRIPAAAIWLRTCGRLFSQDAKHGVTSWGLKRNSRGSNDPSRDLWKAPQDGVMNEERWLAWKQRLEDLKAEEGIVGQAAKSALDAMSVME